MLRLGPGSESIPTLQVDKNADKSTACGSAAEKLLNEYKAKIQPSQLLAVVKGLMMVKDEQRENFVTGLNQLVEWEKERFPDSPANWELVGVVKRAFQDIVGKNTTLAFAYGKALGLPVILLEKQLESYQPTKTLDNYIKLARDTRYKDEGNTPLWNALGVLVTNGHIKLSEVKALKDLIVFSNIYGYLA